MTAALLKIMKMKNMNDSIKFKNSSEIKIIHSESNTKRGHIHGRELTNEEYRSIMSAKQDKK